jgi:REP element-mobilizing transposase RayT
MPFVHTNGIYYFYCMSTGYHIKEQSAVHYITLQVVYWMDVFTRARYKDIIIENFKYCQENKGLEIYAYVIMSNHIHLLVQSSTNSLSDTLRDFKSYTSKKLIESIENDIESRKEWMLFMFKRAAIKHKRNTVYQFWTHENHAEIIYSEKFISQKIDYIHNNPVRSKIVQQPEDYLYSSARNYAGAESMLQVNILTQKWKTVK